MSKANGWTTHVFLPDYQIPYHNKRTVKNHVAFVKDFQPDNLWSVGDFLDSPEPSRWSKGSAGEYAGTLQAGADQAHQVLKDFRAVYSGPFGIRWGNHDERIESYAARFAPALANLRGLKLEAVLRTDEVDVTGHREMVDVAPGWVLAHGHEGALRHTAGLTALALANKIGKSVVCGHTHKVGLLGGGPQGYNGKQVPTRWGMEVGHAMNISQAHYLKTGMAGWQEGIGVLYVKGSTVIPAVFPHAKNGSFVVEGRTYGA